MTKSGTRHKRRCPRCGKEYDLGYNGIKGSCDQCAGVRRDENGYALLPGDSELPQAAPKRKKRKRN